MKQKIMLVYLLPLLWISIVVCGQSNPATITTIKKTKKADHISIAFTNSHTALPFGSFSKLVYGTLHPGIEAGTEVKWKEKKQHDWFQSFRIGYSYHRLVQHSIVLYTEFGYRHQFQKGFSSSLRLGGGYMRAIIANQVFSDGQEGGQQYAKASKGRSQAIVMATIHLGKTLGQNGFAVFLDYQQRLQTPFISSYVSILPYNILMVGVSIPVKF